MRVLSIGVLALAGLVVGPGGTPGWHGDTPPVQTREVETCTGCNISLVEWQQPSDYDQDFYIELALTGPAFATVDLEAYVGNATWISFQNPSLSSASVQLNEFGEGSVFGYYHVNSSCGMLGCGVAGVKITNAGSPAPKDGVYVQID